MKETLLYLQRINAMYNTGVFSKSDRLLADYLLENPTVLEEGTAATLAAGAGVSPATVVRFARKLGFRGLAEMKTSAAQNSYASNYISDNATNMDLVKGDDSATVRNKVIAYSKMIIDQLQDTLNPDKLEEAARMISSARHVVITSEGGSGSIARAAYDIFLKLAIPCRLVEDIMFQMMEISMMGPDDVLFICVNSGRTRNILDNASYAKECGIRTIGIVGPKNSPLAPFLDVELNTCLFDSSYFSDSSSARLSELVTVSVLHSIMALTRDQAQLDKGQEIANSIELKRVSSAADY